MSAAVSKIERAVAGQAFNNQHWPAQYLIDGRDRFWRGQYAETEHVVQTLLRTPQAMASTRILIAAPSNNLVKGIYAYTMADRKTSAVSPFPSIGLAPLGLAPLLWSTA